MKLLKKLIHNRLVRLVVAVAMTVVMTAVSRAAVVGPYAVDDNTLHLWHFDEINVTNPPPGAPTNALAYAYAYDAVTNNLQTSPIYFSYIPGQVGVSGWPGYPPNNFALQGQTSYSYPGVANYGDCVETTNFSCLYPPFFAPNPSTVNSVNWLAGTNLSDVINTNTGAFTFEAMVCPIINPLTAGRFMEIIAGDSLFAFRAWQFRINASGQLEANIGINDPSTWVHLVSKTLPSTGPDAVIVGQWYHTAVTYTGDSPTNGDTPKQLKLYWTAMDPTRTNADVLLATNLTYGFTNIAVPLVTIGGNPRGSPINNVGNSEGFVGYIDEARISSVCRKSTEMAFNTNVFNASPVISGLPTNDLVAYGGTLTLSPSVVGTVPLTNQWYQNGVALAGQTNASLVISNVTFAATGNYQLTATNAFGGINSVVCAVTVGAAFNGVFNTGVDGNGNGLAATAPGSIDLHYQLIQSADTVTVNSNAIVWGATPNAGSVNNNVSGWIGSRNGGSGPAGTYSYQTQFQIDNGDVASATLNGRMWAGGPGANTIQAFLNGVETDFTLQPNAPSTAALFVITNGLQAGSNTLVFTINASSGNFLGAIRVELTGIGNALPPGLPTFNSQPPASETVQYGATAVLPVVALGQPPLSYQWYSNGIAISGATSQNLSFVATNFGLSEVVGGQFSANYQVAVSNASGSVTSSVAALTIQIPPLTVVSAGEPIWNPTNNETNIVVIFSDSLDPVTATAAGHYSLDNSASVLSAAMTAPNEVVLTTSALSRGTTYTLTVQNVNDFFGITMTPSPVSLVVGTYPAAVALWVKANTGVTTNGDGSVSQWNDLSGNNNNLTGGALNGPSGPLFATDPVSGLPVIRFNGTNGTYMTANSTTSLAITNDMTILAVVNFATLAGNTNGMIVSKMNGNNQPAPYDYYALQTGVRLLRGNGSGNAAVISTNARSTGFKHLLDVTMQGTTVTHRLDGNVSGVGTLSTAIADQGHILSIGTREDYVDRLTGDMSELILVGSALSGSDVASLENYFAAEYQLPIGTNSYPAITQQPVSSTNISQGAILTVAAAASGNPAVAYQWYDTNNIAISGQTNATLVISNIQASDSYYLQATNTFGSATSTVVAVNVFAGLNVGLAPASVTIYAGQAYTYSAAALGTVPFYYQWYQGASPIPNATNASYSAVASLVSTTYSCTVTNAYNGYSSTNAGPVTLIGVATPTNLYQTTVVGNHPVAYWRLTEVPDNGSGNNGTIAYDYVGGHNATYTNTILGLSGFSSLSSTDTAAEFGIFGNVTPGNGTVTNNQNSYAGEIDQSGGGLPKIDFATPSGSNAELSVEAWVTVFENVKTNVAQVPGAGIVTKGYGNGGEQFDLDLNGGFRFFVRDAAGSVHSSVSATTPVTNGWYHLVGVWDGASGTAHLYTNGVDVGPSSAAPAGVGLLGATTTNTLLPQAALVSIGSRASSQATNNFDSQFKGRICNVAIYNYALSHARVQADFVAGLKNVTFSASPTNIVSSVTGANLTLSWPADHFGWQLQAQTNSLSVGIWTNWVNVAGSTMTNQVVKPIVPTNGSVFYRLMFNP